MAGKLPSGSSPSLPGARPRAQVSYEGEDQFSAMSLAPQRKANLKTKQQLAPTAPGENDQVKVDELKSTNDQGIVALFRKIFVTDTVGVDTTTRTALPEVTVVVRDVTEYPVTEETVQAWPAYNIFDTIQSPSPDTIDLLSPELVQDSMLVYTVAQDPRTYINPDNTVVPLVLWQDDDVYINGTYPIDPPTIGVATFDGLSRTGYPYNFPLYTAHGVADHLTSVDIDLSTYAPEDSLYLSFFYQPQGLSGDNFVQPIEAWCWSSGLPLRSSGTMHGAHPTWHCNRSSRSLCPSKTRSSSAPISSSVWGTKLGVQFSITFLALMALPVLIIGGFTSIPGAIVGGLIVRAGEKLAEGFLGPHIGGGIEYWFAYVLALAVLLVRPQGLFGERIIERI